MLGKSTSSGRAGGSTVTVVVSPHLDDAIFSIGAWIANCARRDHEIRILTVFAGDPASTEPAGEWDRLCGFGDAGAAARARRAEDVDACRLVGAEPCWLDFADDQYGGHDVDLVWAGVFPHLAGASEILVPGFPLTHSDHRSLAHLVLSRMSPGARIGMYLEQPYAASSADAPGQWSRLSSRRVDRAVKRKACATYTSQMRLLRSKMLRSFLLEALRSREAVRWVEGQSRGAHPLS